MPVPLFAIAAATLPPRSVVRPEVLTLQSAQSYHTTLLQSARAVERAHNHTAPSRLPRAPACAAPASRVFNPVDFGADPTGATDSSDAMEAAMRALLAHNGSGPTMASAIRDLGGVTLDLAGGDYLLSRPLRIPPMVGNLHVRDGTLRASATFSADEWLLNVGNATTCKPKLPSGKPDGQASCNEGITVSNMLFDAAHIAAGGLRVGMVMGTVVTSAFFTGFAKIGLSIEHGHEVMVSDTWLAACYWSDKPCAKSAADTVGIRIDGNDHYLTNVIVFDYTGTGVEVLGAANVLEAVHTWNGGGVGISLGTAAAGSYGAHQNRLLGCYLDYNTLDMYDPSSTVIESTFFLETYAVIHALKGTIDGLVMRYNSYTTPQSVVLDGSFSSAKNVLISDEVGASKSTRARRVVTRSGAASGTYSFDFSDALLFPWIDSVQYSVTLASGFAMHAARPPNGTRLVVELDGSGGPRPSDATVEVEVAQAL